MGNDMTKGRPLPIILRFMLTMLVGNIFQQLYNMADTIIVGRFVGADALAAVGSTGTLMFLVLGVCQGMTTGFSVMTSQRFGAKDEKGVRLSVSNGIILSVIIIIVMTAVSLLSVGTLLHLMNTPDSIYPFAKQYITLIFAGIACSVFYNLLAAYLRAVGNSRTPVYFLILSAALNVVLDLVFIINFKMGVAGAAIATDISQGVSAGLSWVYIVRKCPSLRPGAGEWRLDSHMAKNQIRIGLPMALQFGITASGTTIMQAAINLFGPAAVAATAAAGKLSNLLAQGMMSIGQTMTAYSGQNFGVRSLPRLKEGIKSALLIQAVYSAIFGVLYCVLLPCLLPVFFTAGTDLKELLPYAWTYAWQCAVMFFPLSCIFIFRNTMQGCGYALLPTCCGIVEFFSRLGAALLSMKLHSFALAAGCDPIAWLCGSIFGLAAWLWVIKDLPRRLKLEEFEHTEKSPIHTF